MTVKRNKKKIISGTPVTRLRRSEALLARELRVIYYHMIDDIISKLRPIAAQEAFVPVAINIDALGEKYETDIYAAIARHKIPVIEASAMHMANQLKVPLDRRYYNIYIEQTIMDRTFKIVTTKITPTIKNELKNVLISGMQQGASASQIIKHFDMLKTNYRTIARTEINTAANQSSYMLATHELSAVGLQGAARKHWITAGDEKVREAHAKAGIDYGLDSGIPLDQPFLVGGEALYTPADYSGSAGNIINCRCTYKITFE